MEKSRGLYLFSLFAIFIIYSLIEFFFPLMSDDWAVSYYWRDNSHDGSFSLGALFGYYADLKNDANGRLANLVAPIFICIAPWKHIFPWLTGAFMAGIIVIIQRMATYRLKVNPFWALSLSWVLILVLLPWRDSIFVADFALNYIYSSGLSLLFLYFIIRFESVGWNFSTFVPMALLAVLAGGWHEGFAFTLLCGIFLYILSRKFKVSYQFYTLFILLFISALFFIMSVGMVSRMNSAVNSFLSMPDGLKKGASLIPLVLTVTLILSLTICPRGRRVLGSICKNPFCIVGSGVIISGYAISIFLSQPLRSTFWPALFCCLVILAVVVRMFHRPVKKGLPQLALTYFSTFLVLFCIGINIICIVWIKRFRNEADFILNEFAIHGGGTVFHDKINPADLPLYTLFIPPRHIWESPSNYFYLWAFNRKNFMGVVPSALQYADYSNAVPLDLGKGWKFWNGHLIAPFDEGITNLFYNTQPEYIGPRSANVKLEYTSGMTTASEASVFPFITKPFLHSDGSVIPDTLVYLKLPSGAPVEKISNIEILNIE